MDPDVMVTVGFVTYAVLVAIGAGVGVGVVIARGHRDANMDDDAAQPGGARPPSQGKPRATTRCRRNSER